MYKPNYQITDSLVNKISKIENVRTQIDSSYILPEREIEMHHRATVEATHSSTSIEGNPLNIKQVQKALSDKNPVTRHRYAEMEVRNYKKAIDFIDERKITGKKISLKDILTIHKIITDGLLEPEKTGTLRQNHVYIENQNGVKIYDGPNAKDLTHELNEFLEWLNIESYNIHPVIAAAIVHFHFVSIHPMADGNGRTTRILTSLYLGLRNYDFRGSLVLDSYYSTNKPDYYAALHGVQGENYLSASKANLDPWIDYFTDGFLASANVLAAEVTLLSSMAKGLRIKQKISRDEADLLSYIQQFSSITLSEAERVLINTSRRTVQRKLKKLVDSDYVQTEGNGRDTKYTLIRQ